MIMFRQQSDFKTFPFKKIIQHLKIFIFTQKCFICAGNAFLQDKPIILYLKILKI